MNMEKMKTIQNKENYLYQPKKPILSLKIQPVQEKGVISDMMESVNSNVNIIDNHNNGNITQEPKQNQFDKTTMPKRWDSTTNNIQYYEQLKKQYYDDIDYVPNKPYSICLKNIFSIFGILLVLAITVALACCKYNSDNVFMYINVPIYGLSFALLTHIQLVYHNFYKINLRKKLWIVLFILSILVYGFSWTWGKIKLLGWLGEYSSIFLLLPIPVCFLFMIILNSIYQNKILYKRITYIYKDKPLQKKRLTEYNLKLKQVANKDPDQQILDHFNPDKSGPSINLAMFNLLICMIISLSVGQGILANNEPQMFFNKIDQDDRYIILLCSTYPMLMGICNGIKGFLNEKFEIELKFQMIYFNHILAALPYRFLFFKLQEANQIAIVLVVKIIFKFIAFVVKPLLFERTKRIQANVQKTYEVMKQSIKIKNNSNNQKLPLQNTATSSEMFKSKQIKQKENGNNHTLNQLSQNLSLKQQQQQQEDQMNQEKVFLTENQKIFFFQQFGSIQFNDLISTTSVYIITLLYYFVLKDYINNHIVEMDDNQIKILTSQFFVEFFLEIFITIGFSQLISLNINFKDYNLQKLLSIMSKFLMGSFHFIVAITIATYALVFIIFSNNL